MLDATREPLLRCIAGQCARTHLHTDAKDVTPDIATTAQSLSGLGLSMALVLVRLEHDVTGHAQRAEGLMHEYDRGYSEVTFSRLAALTGARGILHREFHLSLADPKLMGVVQKPGRTNNDMADQLSIPGMEAINPKAAKMLRQAEVPLRATNAFEPHDPGTLIDDQPVEDPTAEIVTWLDLIALEVFEQERVGVKGCDATILDVLRRHLVRIVPKNFVAKTIIRYVDVSLEVSLRVEKDLVRRQGRVRRSRGRDPSPSPACATAPKPCLSRRIGGIPWYAIVAASA